MANLCITRSCRRGCTYCFAQHERARAAVLHMSAGVYEAALEFLERSRIPEARLLGGEPTEHPQFTEFAELARKRGLRVVVFSGGLIPPPALELMTSWPSSAISVLLNAADPASDGRALVDRQLDVCRTLGAKVMLGINLRSPDQDPRYLFDWIKEYSLFPRIRVGLAHPIWGGRNDFFRQRGPREIPLLEDLMALGIREDVDVGFDCGITPCMFSPEFIEAHQDMLRPGNSGPGRTPDCDERLTDPAGMFGSEPERPTAPSRHSGEPLHHRSEATEMPGEPIGMRCHPVVDILPEGTCIACYALSRFRRIPFPTTGVYRDVVVALDTELAPALPLGVHRECGACGYRTSAMCSGGCRARRAFRLRPEPSTPLCHDPPDEPLPR